MAIKAVVDSIEGISEALHAEYKQGDDGKYHLDIDGLDDHPGVGALKRAKEREKLERQRLSKESADMRAQFDALIEERDGMLKGAIPKGNVEALEKSWQDKFTRRERELLDQHEAMNQHLRAATVSATASSVAARLAVPGSASVLSTLIERRLSFDIRDGKPITTILDKDGRPSALTVAELEEEIKGDVSLAPLIIGSMASGAGGAPSSKGGGAAKKAITRGALDALDPYARAEHFRSGGTVID